MIGNIARFIAPVVQVLGGQFRIQVDLTKVPEPPALGVTVVAGDTWKFQCRHRDFLPGSGPTSNFTDAVIVDFE